MAKLTTNEIPLQINPFLILLSTFKTANVEKVVNPPENPAIQKKR